MTTDAELVARLLEAATWFGRTRDKDGNPDECALRDIGYNFGPLFGPSAARIEALAAEVATLNVGYAHQLGRANKLDEALARAEAAERDAERYRWLRRFDHFSTVDAMLNSDYNTLDSAVDAAALAEKHER